MSGNRSIGDSISCENNIATIWPTIQISGDRRLSNAGDTDLASMWRVSSLTWAFGDLPIRYLRSTKKRVSTACLHVHIFIGGMVMCIIMQHSTVNSRVDVPVLTRIMGLQVT